MLTLRFLAFAISGVLVAIAATGCARGGGEETTASAPVKSDRVRKMQYEAKASGSVVFDVAGTFDVRVLTIRSDSEEQKATTLLSVGPNVVLPIEGGKTARVAFDLTGFKGDGEYRIRAGSPRDLSPQAGATVDASKLDQSNVLVQVWPPGVAQQEQPTVYDVVVEPCPLSVSDGGDTGHLRCPRMSAPEGEFSLEMRWSLP